MGLGSLAQTKMGINTTTDHTVSSMRRVRIVCSIRLVLGSHLHVLEVLVLLALLQLEVALLLEALHPAAGRVPAVLQSAPSAEKTTILALDYVR